MNKLFKFATNSLFSLIAIYVFCIIVVFCVSFIFWDIRILNAVVHWFNWGIFRISLLIALFVGVLMSVIEEIGNE